MKKQNFFVRVLLKFLSNFFVSLDDYKKLESEVKEINEKLTSNKVSEILDPSLHEFPEKSLKIRIVRAQGHDSKDVKLFHFSRPLDLGITEKNEVIVSYPFRVLTCEPSEQSLQYARSILETKLVEKIYLRPFSVEIHKSAAVNWTDVIPAVLEVISSFFEKRREKVISERDKIDIRDDNEIPK